MLNLARPDVRAHILDFLDKLLTENDIAFLKWDYNRNWSEPGWDQVPPAEQKQVYVEYTKNLYGIFAECGSGIRSWRLNRAPAAAGAWTWGF